jgi:hypothetical protein
VTRRGGRRGPAPPTSSDARFRESVSQATDISNTATSEEQLEAGTDTSGSARRRARADMPILPAPARPTSWGWKTVVQAIGVSIATLGIIGIVIAEAVRMESGLSTVNEKLGHVVEKIEKLVEGVGKIDGQTQDVKTDLHELRRDFDEQRLKRAEQGHQTAPRPAESKPP